MQNPYRDRVEAGRVLAQRLQPLAGRPDVLVLALPRGGVPVAFEVAQRLRAPLDVFVVRKLGVPGHEELAMGAIASGGVRILDSDLIEQLGIDEEAVEATTAREERELLRRERLFRGDRPHPRVAGRTVPVVADGPATGASMRVAVQALRGQAPARVGGAGTVAVPSARVL